MALGPRHAALLSKYVIDLRAAVNLAQAERARELDFAISSGIPADKGRAALEKQRGLAAAHPRVLGVVIENFFRCAKLNEEIEAEGGEEFVEPLTFVYEMLSGEYEDLWRFLATLPYLPLGLRQDDSRV